MDNKKSIWNEAGVAGLVLGGVCIIYLTLSWLLSKILASGPSVTILVSLSNVVLWAAKFVGCIVLMRVSLLKYSISHPEADNGAVFKYGVLVAFLSALVFSAFYMVYLLYLAPDQIQEVLDSLASNPMMDSSSIEMVESMMPKMPTLGFFFNLIYCTLFGTVLSAIFSRSIPPQNPFKDDNTDEQ